MMMVAKEHEDAHEDAPKHEHEDEHEANDQDLGLQSWIRLHQSLSFPRNLWFTSPLAIISATGQSQSNASDPPTSLCSSGSSLATSPGHSRSTAPLSTVDKI